MNKQALAILHSLLSDLFSDIESQLDHMGSDIITSDLIPDDLPVEKAIMRGFELCEEKGVLPIPENVALLSLSKDEKTLEFCRQLASKANEHSLIRANAIWWKSFIEQELLNRASKEISELAKMDYGDVHEKQSMMLDRLISLPLQDKKQTFTRIDIIEQLSEAQIKRVEAYEQNKVLGSILHLEGLREAVPVLNDGDVTLITAPPKAGKTTCVMYLSEANTIQNDIDVLVLLAETSPKTIEERFIAKDLLIPGWALRKGIVDLTKTPYKKAYESYIESEENIWNTLGRVYFQYIAGFKISQIASEIRIHKRLADKRGRTLLVIIDYLQRIAKPNRQSDVEAIALISNSLKDIAVRYDCHIILFSQETLSSEANNRGDSRAHGSNTPIFVAQNHIALKVLNCTRNILVEDEDGALHNRLGRERYWQKAGRNKRQSVVRFDIIRTNNDDTGSAYAAIENELFLMTDCSISEMSLAPFIREDIQSFDEDLLNPNRKLI